MASHQHVCFANTSPLTDHHSGLRVATAQTVRARNTRSAAEQTAAQNHEPWALLRTALERSMSALASSTYSLCVSRKVDLRQTRRSIVYGFGVRPSLHRVSKAVTQSSTAVRSPSSARSAKTTKACSNVRNEVTASPKLLCMLLPTIKRMHLYNYHFV